MPHPDADKWLSMLESTEAQSKKREPQKRPLPIKAERLNSGCILYTPQVKWRDMRTFKAIYCLDWEDDLL